MKKTTQRKHENGFTLVELAIALMVIGLLIGGVLKGQELIENARIVRVVKDMNDYDTAVMIFRSTYNALPGDIRNPTRIPNCNDAPCNNTVGVGNGRIAETSTGGSSESGVKSKNFWIHLERAGLITGNDEDETYRTVRPINTIEGYYIAVHSATGNDYPAYDPTMNAIYLATSFPSYDIRFFPLKYLQAIDEKMDDGKPLTGVVVATKSVYPPSAGTVHAPGTTCLDPEETNTYVSSPNPETTRCLALVRLGSLQ